ncbi:MAG: hypothetical protein ACYDBH_16335 [Acidobacteriaceae bacterium]
MASKMHITYDGNVPGLADHRLSVDSFGKPLEYLLAALRRIATQIVGSAIEGENPSVGRFATLARQIDIDLVGIEEGSCGLAAELAFRPPPNELAIFADLPERAAEELLTDIERESRGQLTHSSVRRYLRSLPTGLTHQVYELFDTGGRSKSRVELGEIKLTEIPEELPYLVEHEGKIVGVGFEPGRPEVKIKSELGVLQAEATTQEVESALKLRNETVRLLAVQNGKKTKFLTLNVSSAPRFQVTPEATARHIFDRWSEAFARLAE